MVNSQVVSEIEKALKIDKQVEKIPAAIPVVEVGIKSVKDIKIGYATATNTTSTTILTTPTDRDFYVVGGFLTGAKDAGATTTNLNVKVTIDGTSTPLLRITTLSGTANQAAFGSISLPHPIKVDRGTNIVLESGTNAANVTLAGAVYYFLDEVS